MKRFRCQFASSFFSTSCSSVSLSYTRAISIKHISAIGILKLLWSIDKQNDVHVLDMMGVQSIHTEREKIRSNRGLEQRNVWQWNVVVVRSR